MNHYPPPPPHHHPPEPPSWNPITNINRRLSAIEEKLTQIGVSMATQADIDALTQAVSDLTAKVTADDSQLQAGVAAVQAWIASQPADVDVSGLQDAVGQLSAGVDAVGTDAENVANLVPPATS